MASTKSYYKDPFKNNTPTATAQKIAANAKGKPVPKAASKKNAFSGLSNAQIKAKYKAMSQADKKKFGMQMHAAAMANRKKGGTMAKSQPSTTTRSTKPAPVQPRSAAKPQSKQQSKPQKSKPSNKAVSGGYTISPGFRKPGSRGDKGWLYSKVKGVRTAYNDITGAHWYHNGKKWVQGKIKVTRFKGPK